MYGLKKGIKKKLQITNIWIQIVKLISTQINLKISKELDLYPPPRPYNHYMKLGIFSFFFFFEIK